MKDANRAELSRTIKTMASTPSTYRVVAEGDNDVARGLPIADALAEDSHVN
ncbi:MAG TPA: hypothetical protein VF765_04120 [Polyangiaceae bacterium]